MICPCPSSLSTSARPPDWLRRRSHGVHFLGLKRLLHGISVRSLAGLGEKVKVSGTEYSGLAPHKITPMLGELERLPAADLAKCKISVVRDGDSLVVIFTDKDRDCEFADARCLLHDSTGRMLRKGKATSSSEVEGIFARLRSTAQAWGLRMKKLSGGRLIGRFLAASRDQLRQLASTLRVCHLANVG